MNKLLALIIGPTAVGKTSVSIELAQYFKTEIISADSRQIFEELKIGTAKPTEQELNLVPHHLINSHSIQDSYNAGQFADDASKLLTGLFKKQGIVLVVGGSGLYVKALCEGLDEMPAVPVEIREALNADYNENGLDDLLAELHSRDPDYFEKVDRANPQRVIRALEVIRTTSNTFSSYQSNDGRSKSKRPYHILKIGLEMERAELYQRIDQRMDEMIKKGLFTEAKVLYPLRQHQALQTVGYKEIFDYLDGEYDEAEAVRLLKRNSRRYAKRQLTWFKKETDVHWFHPNQLEDMKILIEATANP